MVSYLFYTRIVKGRKEHVRSESCARHPVISPKPFEWLDCAKENVISLYDIFLMPEHQDRGVIV